MRYSKSIISVFLSVFGFVASAAEIEWSGNELPVLREEVASSTGLEAVFVASSVSGLTISYTGDGAGSAVWSRYSALGGGYAEQVATGATLTSPEGDMGYIVEAGGRSYAFWLVDYSRHELSIDAVSESPEQECGRVTLDISGEGDEIVYYSINGRRMTLSRDMQLEYMTLRFSETSGSYVETRTTESIEYLKSEISVMAPLCATEFTLSGDRFLKEWGLEQSVTSVSYEPHSVEAHTEAVQQERDASNEVKDQSGSFGGSAPCVVDFTASVTDAAIFREWQFSRSSDFDDVSLRVNDLEFTHTFVEDGSTYVRFYCANADASCDYYGETYEISIGESFLKCPNAFSPFNEDGVNDEWKVSYSSIVSFECTIFNRGGHKIFSFSDPSAGWNGKYGGKFVPAGVYYYVIKARGADGRNYNLSGDINIVDYK